MRIFYSDLLPATFLSKATKRTGFIFHATHHQAVENKILLFVRLLSDCT